MNGRKNLILPIVLVLTVFCLPARAQVNLPFSATGQLSIFSHPEGETERDRDGLVGPVRRVRTETAKLSTKGGKLVESEHVVMESVAYDIRGNKTESAYFPVPGSALTGKEVYKYDDKGNIVEMSLFNADGSLLSKEVYAYEFDNFGNWTKMTTSVAVLEGGKVIYEPTEVTYRIISYYLVEATLAKMNQPAGAPAQQNPSGAAAANASATSPQLANAAANKPAPPSPGASLVKANMPISESSLGMPGVNAAASSGVKIEGEAPPVARTPAPKPLLKPVSGGVLNGKAVMLPKPMYPPAARNAQASGMVTVEVVIDESGKVISAKATSGHTLLRPAAVQAAQGARFSPTLLSGQPVKISGEINYNFSLQ